MNWLPSKQLAEWQLTIGVSLRQPWSHEATKPRRSACSFIVVKRGRSQGPSRAHRGCLSWARILSRSHTKTKRLRFAHALQNRGTPGRRKERVCPGPGDNNDAMAPLRRKRLRRLSGSRRPTHASSYVPRLGGSGGQFSVHERMPRESGRDAPAGTTRCTYVCGLLICAQPSIGWWLVTPKTWSGSWRWRLRGLHRPLPFLAPSCAMC